MLFKFREAQLTDLGLQRARSRPRSTQEVQSTKDCEYWRSDVIAEISRKVSKIMDRM